MSPILLAVVTAIYVCVALNYAKARHWGMCLAFLAYALANVGFILDWMRR